MNQQYITSNEPLFFIDRLDRFSPLTSKFISFGANVATPLTQNEVIDVILGNKESSRTLISRRLAASHIGAGVRNNDTYYNADNNHSGFWESGFVHNIPRPLTFWNLDDDFETVLRESLVIDPKIGANLIRSIVFNLLDGEASLTEALQNNPDNKLLYWLDEKRHKLPPAPDTENFDVEVSTKFYDSVDEDIFNPLTETTEFNGAIIELCTSKAKDDNHFKQTTLDSLIIRSVFPKNDNADGYIINGFKTLMPTDAMRGAIYVGNVCEALQMHENKQNFVSDISDAYTLRDKTLESNLYPVKMVNGMASDWITGTRFTKSDSGYAITHGSQSGAFDMALLPKAEYPQIGELCLLQINCRRQDVESDVIVNSPQYEELRKLVTNLRTKHASQIKQAP